MSTISNAFIEEMKKKMLNEKVQLSKTLSSLKSQDPFSDRERLNDNAASDTEAKEETDHDRYEALIKEQKKRMSDLEAALKRIEENTYGTCLKCGESIEEKRLTINPAALYCASCEKSLEK